MNTVDGGLMDGHNRAEQADEYRREGDFGMAGEQYSVAAYAFLAEGSPSGFCKQVSWGLYELLFACVCYRMGGNVSRSRNRCRQGILIAEDTVERVNNLSATPSDYDRARRGAWHEFIGDFQVIASDSGVKESYEQAKKIYNEAGDPSSGLAEQEHMRLHDFFETIAFSQHHDAEEWYRIRAEAPLTQWVEYKAEYLPKYLNELYQQDEWNRNTS